MRLRRPLIPVVAVSLVVAAVAMAAAAPASKPAPASRPAPSPGGPAGAQSGLTLELKSATVEWDCPSNIRYYEQRCGEIVRVVAVTLTDGFVVVTQDNGARTIIPRERFIRLVDIATVAEKP